MKMHGCGIAAWLAKTPRWTLPLQRDEPLSLFNPERVAPLAQD